MGMGRSIDVAIVVCAGGSLSSRNASGMAKFRQFHNRIIVGDE
jgi:hypothetical protein